MGEVWRVFEPPPSLPHILGKGDKIVSRGMIQGDKAEPFGRTLAVASDLLTVLGLLLQPLSAR